MKAIKIMLSKNVPLLLKLGGIYNFISKWAKLPRAVHIAEGGNQERMSWLLLSEIASKEGTRFTLGNCGMCIVCFQAQSRV